MPKIQYITTNFTAGVLSPKVRGRVDLERYNNGAKVLHNCYPVLQGGVKRRPGTRYVRDPIPAVVVPTCEETYGETFFTEFLDTFSTDGALNGASAEVSPNDSWTYTSASATRANGIVSPATFEASGDQVGMWKTLFSVGVASGETITVQFDGAGYYLQVVLALGSGEACSFSYVNPDPEFGETITDTFSIGATPGNVMIGVDGALSYVEPNDVLHLYLSPDLTTDPVATVVKGLNSFPSYTQLSSFSFSSTGSSSTVNFIRICANSGG